MIRGKDIIIISSIDWDFIWQGHQEIASVLAKEGNRVLFIENTGVRIPTLRDVPRLWKRFINWRKGFRGVRKEAHNLYVYAPLALPFPHSGLAIKINKILMLSVIRKWMRAMEFHNPITWSFLPTGIVLDMLNELDPSVFIYYCIDDFASSSKGARRIRKAEDKVIRKADLVFATSHKLYERCAEINSNTHLFPFGINVDNYNRIRESSLGKPGDMLNIKSPIIGYVGGIHKWIDMGLLKRIALRKDNISFVLIGPGQTDLEGIDKLCNVFMLGKKNGSELPNYVKFFDAGIIPYKKTSYTDNVYPTKINEYLAMGKSVISTRIPEVVNFNEENGGDFIYFIENEEDIDEVASRLGRGDDISVIEKRVSVANRNSWASKIENMSGLISAKLYELDRQMNKDWLGRFRSFYSKSRGRAIKIASALLISYAALFYTPIAWFFAAPLRIDNKPEAADAIVVFGGGVGEGGRPGPSTIERARHSSALYKAGFAKNIIFSSGYKYESNDAENMKLIALSMGVPEERIILEQKAGSTYENVKFTEEILSLRKWNKILLVTSPYNSRRASLAFKKFNRRDTEVLYCPVKNPEFYYRYGKLRVSQLKAVIHEYMAILYYAWKGYI